MDNTVFREIKDLVSALKDSLKNEFLIITIDGVDGVGKSTLARTLSEQLGIQNVKLDSYVIPDRGTYADSIRYGALESVIDQAKAKLKPVIIDAVCVLEVLERLRLESDVTVYVRLVKPDGFWYHEYSLFPPEKNAEEVIAEDHESTRKMVEWTPGPIDEDALEREGLRESIIRYHYSYKPHQTADFIFERVENNS